MDGSRIRKEKVADSKISECVWTGPKKYQIGSNALTDSIINFNSGKDAYDYFEYLLFMKH